MNKEEAKVLLPIIKAFSEGQVIEYRRSNGDWCVATAPNWARDVDYRLRPTWADLSPGDPVLVKDEGEALYKVRVFKGVTINNSPITYNTESSKISWNYCKPFNPYENEHKL